MRTAAVSLPPPNTDSGHLDIINISTVLWLCSLRRAEIITNDSGELVMLSSCSCSNQGELELVTVKLAAPTPGYVLPTGLSSLLRTQ